MYYEVPWRLINRLSYKRSRDRAGLTIVESPPAVLSAIEAGVDLQIIVVTKEFNTSEKGDVFRQTLDGYPKRLKVFEVSESFYGKISHTKQAQGIMGLIKLPFSFLKTTPKGLWDNALEIVGADIQDPGNVGTLIRTGASVGADRVVFCGESADPYSPKAIRASAGAIFNVQTIFHRDCIRLLEEFLNSGKSLYKAVPKGGAAPWKTNFNLPCALVVGNEARGLSPTIMNLPGDWVTIPMPGKTESLNVAMACSVLSYEVVRQRTKQSQV